MRYTRVLAALAVAGALTGTAMAASGSIAVVKVRATSLGSTLVASNGKTLYMFAHDTTTKSTCSGSCATFWPPLLTTGQPKAGPGVHAALLGTTHRAGGKLQVTYHGHPLYFFANDKKAGATSGEGVKAFGAEWYVLTPAGSKVVPAPMTTTTPTTTTTPAGGGGGGGGGGYG
jgi:predicted lipoprotein with Yx(FWY)xxD motif